VLHGTGSAIAITGSTNVSNRTTGSTRASLFGTDNGATIIANQTTKSAPSSGLPGTGSARTSNTPTVTNHTGAAYATACSNSWTSWSSASASFISSHIAVSTVTTTYTNTLNYPRSVSILGRPENASTAYATCMDIPRYSGSWIGTETITVAANNTSVFPIAVTKTLANFTEPTPTCSITPTDCSNLLDAWHETHYLVYPFNASTGASWPNGAPLDYPHCNSTYMEGDLDCSGCWLIAEDARLFYWPEPAVAETNSYCPDSYVLTASSTAAPTALVTAVVTLTNEVLPNITS
jgi:hypothetical protein